MENVSDEELVEVRKKVAMYKSNEPTGEHISEQSSEPNVEQRSEPNVESNADQSTEDDEEEGSESDGEQGCEFDLYFATSSDYDTPVEDEEYGGLKRVKNFPIFNPKT